MTSNTIKNNNQSINVLLSTNLNFDFDKLKYFKNKNLRRIVFTTNDAPKRKIEELKEFSEVFVARKDSQGLVDVKEVYDVITKKYKCKKILIEGGGLLNNSFLKKNIVDDIYLTICPLIVIDTTSRSFVEGIGLTKKDIKRLKLLDIKKNKFNEIFLHYKIQKNLNG